MTKALRDRIKDFRRVPASTLRPNPKNWRKHPAQQRELLAGLLADVGYADALLARELADGSLELVDGHLRAELTPDAVVPVLVLDLDEGEADKLLALLDPLSAMAETDTELLTALVSRLDSDNAAVQAGLAALVAPLSEAGCGEQPDVDIPETFQVVVDCENEVAQRALYERLVAERFDCRLLVL